MRSRLWIVLAILMQLLTGRCQTGEKKFVGPLGPYLGQKPPTETPEVFAPGFVSSEHQEHSSLSISPDGREMWWSRWRLPLDMDRYPQVIVFIRSENGRWSKPEVAPFSGRYRDGGPAFSPDGRRIYFYSRRPVEEDTATMHDNDLWYVERIENEWGPPVHLGQPVNSPFVEATPCLAANGNLYFTSDRNQYDDPVGNNDLFLSRFKNGEFGEPEGLGKAINTPHAREGFPYVAPDESYIIFSRDSRHFDSDGKLLTGERKLMISFKGENGEWQESVDMGTEFDDTRFPSVSPDGKYLFFTKITPERHEDFFWVDAKIIEKFRPKE
jgi:Tol biopolymer transport system component